MYRFLASLFLVLVCGLAVRPAATQRIKTDAAVLQRSVPSEMSDVARVGTVGDFARALARGKVPAGVVVSRQDRKPTSTAGQRREGQAGALTTLGGVVPVFRAQHPAYDVEEGPGRGLFVALSNTPCRAALKRPLLDLKLTGPVYRVGFDLLRIGNPSVPNISPGIVSGGPAEIPSVLTEQVSLFYQRLTLHEALDEIVRQVPGLVWMLVDDIDRRDSLPACILNWVAGTGSSITTYDFLQMRSR